MTTLKLISSHLCPYVQRAAIALAEKSQPFERVYVDTSKNAKRRFCSTACQNRTKAAAFRQRRR